MWEKLFVSSKTFLSYNWCDKSLKQEIEIRMRTKLFNRWIFEKFGKIAAAVATVFSIAIIYIPAKCQLAALWTLLSLLVLSYVGVVICANFKKQVTIRIRNTKIVIKQGDLFTEEGQKVIPMNEFFDVDIESGVVDPESLHGQYIRNHAHKAPQELYDDIIKGLQCKNPVAVDQKREHGGQIKYGLGTIYDDKKWYYLLAYSKFDKDNRAYLTNEDIARCYTNMWNEIDIIRGSQSIAVPVFGAGGIVRFSKEYTPQQLIELILWSFRISGIQLSRRATLSVVVHESLINDIDFLKLSYYSD